MSGVGPNGAALMIIGEAPGETEDREGVPFCGDSGRLLDDVLGGVGIRRASDCYVTNAVRCRPPGNRSPSDTKVKACVAAHLADEIERVRPAAILALGNSALFALTGLRNITANRGRWFAYPLQDESEIPVRAAFHPSYVLRLNGGVALDDLIVDVEQAWGVACGGDSHLRDPLEGTNYRVVRTLDDLEEAYSELSESAILAYDVETTSLNPFLPNADGTPPLLVCVQISAAPKTGWLFPILHPDAEESICDICPKVIEALLGPDGWADLVGQNVKFDMKWIRQSLGFWPRRPAFDTMVAHHLLSEDSSKVGGNDLKSMSRRYTDMGGYDEEMKTELERCGNNMALVSLDILGRYGCGDVDATLRVREALLPALEEERLLEVLNLEMSKTAALAEIEFRGACVDWEYLEFLDRAFSWSISKEVEALHAYPETARAFEIHSDRRKMKLKEGEVFNHRSKAQVEALLLEVCGLRANEEELTETGAYSLSKDVLEWMLDGLNPSSPHFRLLETLIKLRSAEKLYSGYVKPFPGFKGTDNRIHPDYKHAFVSTWRLSSANPNMQQLPRKEDEEKADSFALSEDVLPWWKKLRLVTADKKIEHVIGSNVEVWKDEIYESNGGRVFCRPEWKPLGLHVGRSDLKRIFIPPAPGWLIGEADYSQIELRIAALISQDGVMLGAFRSGLDCHRLTASAMYGKSSEDVTDEERSKAKIVNFGILYGMTEVGLARKLGVSEREAARWLIKHKSTYSGYWQWVQAQHRFALENGYVESMFGHRRRLSNLTSYNASERMKDLNRAVNQPVQCTASNLCLYAMALIVEILRESGAESYVWGQVHDSIVFAFPESEKVETCRIVLEVMQGLPFPFLCGEDPRWPVSVPITVDLSVGKNLLDRQPVLPESLA